MTTPETVWEVPEPRSTLEVPVDGGTVVTVRRHGAPDGPRIVLSHGTGLAIDLYYPFWSLLTADFDVIVYDLRNHGWNHGWSNRRPYRAADRSGSRRHHGGDRVALRGEADGRACSTPSRR